MDSILLYLSCQRNLSSSKDLDLKMSDLRLEPFPNFGKQKTKIIFELIFFYIISILLKYQYPLGFAFYQ